MTPAESAAALYRRFGAAVRAHREHRGLSVPELAARCDMRPYWVEWVEAGTVELHLDQAAALAAAFGLTLVQLLQSAEEMP